MTNIPGTVTTHPRVAAGDTWVFYVRHDRSGSWAFLPLNHLRARRRCIIACADLLAFDKSLNYVLDLPRGWHAHRQRREAKWQTSPIPSGPTHLLICEAIPLTGTSDRAFVQCWIRCRLKADAKRLATTLMASSGWTPVSEIEHLVMRKDTVRPIHRKYFEQVQIEGEVMVLVTYPTRSHTSPPNKRLERTRR